MRFLILLCVLPFFTLSATLADSANTPSEHEQAIAQLEQPLYNAFTERYILDELKSLRIDMQNQRVDLIEQVVDKELRLANRSISYVTDAMTYFFYLIAIMSSLLVIIGWNSIRDIKEKVHTLADHEITRIVNTYEKRLKTIEAQLNQKSEMIVENSEQIEKTNEIQSLWLKAGQDLAPLHKVDIYDAILTIRPQDTEALSYKADMVLELNQPHWAVNLCKQALEIDPDSVHALYQLACAYAQLDQPQEAIKCLRRVLELSESYREKIAGEVMLAKLQAMPEFSELVQA
ncbi:MAG TPA: tetratricopeptide repeat protein [Pseudomonadales bacterium]